MKRLTQKQKTLDCLIRAQGHWVSANELVARGCGYRYGARVEELRKDGCDIDTRPPSTISAVGSYRLNDWRDYELAIPQRKPASEIVGTAKPSQITDSGEGVSKEPSPDPLPLFGDEDIPAGRNMTDVDQRAA